MEAGWIFGAAYLNTPLSLDLLQHLLKDEEYKKAAQNIVTTFMVFDPEDPILKILKSMGVEPDPEALKLLQGLSPEEREQVQQMGSELAQEEFEKLEKDLQK